MSSPPAAATQAAEPKAMRRVFIVHGHDRAPVEACARLLTTLGLEPVILDEQPNRGRTIIKKLEQHTDVAFAVAVLSPDDHGGIAGETTAPRARQNVILELGFFIGKLGRHRVAALVDRSVEVPERHRWGALHSARSRRRVAFATREGATRRQARRDLNKI